MLVILLILCFSIYISLNTGFLMNLMNKNLLIVLWCFLVDWLFIFGYVWFHSQLLVFRISEIMAKILLKSICRFFYVSLAEKSGKSSYRNQAICEFFFLGCDFRSIFISFLKNKQFFPKKEKLSSSLFLYFLISQTFSRPRKEKGKCLCTYLWFNIVYSCNIQCLQ